MKKRSLEFTSFNIKRGILIYSAGDLVAMLLLNEFMWSRLLGMIILGGSLYAFEIPNYFKWIDKKMNGSGSFLSALKRTGLAMAYFNPLWIARHLLLLKCFSLQFDTISLHLIYLGTLSFLVNIPISFVANYLIQNKFPLKWRFTASATFSALMAIYYAFTEVLFN